MIAGGWFFLLQVPIIDAKEWPVIALIVAIVGAVVLAGWRAYTAVTDRLEKSRDKEIEAAKVQRAWQEARDEKQLSWQKDQNDAWRAALFALETRRDENDKVIATELSRHDKERSESDRATLQIQLKIAEKLDMHDMQAKEIHEVVRRIEQNTQPRSQVNKGSSRGAG